MKDTLEYKFVTISIHRETVYMFLHNGKENKLKNPEFLCLEEWNQWMQEKRPKALIIAGEARHFSTGADLMYLKETQITAEQFKKEMSKGKRILDYIEKLPIVTVAAISGICCGAGLEIALSCQFRIAAENSVFSFPETTLGLIPGMGGTIRLPKTIGRSQALKMILSGENYFASEALEMGLVDAVTEKKKHLEEAEKLVQMLCKNKSMEQIHSLFDSMEQKDMQYETEQFVRLLKKQNIVR